jgi:hypothetical protein
VRAEPPRYHLEEAGHLIEPPQQPAVAVAPALGTVRCPKCREKFSWTAERPTRVECPHCGVRGVLR